jgi:hypothetical protein
MIFIRYSGILSLLCFGAILINISIGKYYVISGQGTSPPIDGVPEFFLLAAATGFMAIWLLKQEQCQS